MEAVVPASHLRASTLEAMSLAADGAAALARRGESFNLYRAVAKVLAPDSYTLQELSDISWAATVGYREGLEVPR